MTWQPYGRRLLGLQASGTRCGDRSLRFMRDEETRKVIEYHRAPELEDNSDFLCQRPVETAIRNHE